MKKRVKAVLLLMIALTVVYVSAVVYANTNSSYDDSYDYAPNSHRYVGYAAFKYEQDTPPTEWYTLDELGIVEVWELNNRTLRIAVDREKEPFPYGPYGTPDQRTRFLYNGEFYTVAHRWITFGGSAVKQWQMPVGIALGVGWIFTGALFLKGRKNEKNNLGIEEKKR